MIKIPLRKAALAVLMTGFALAAAPASAGDVTVFVTFPSPDVLWNRGYGAALSSTWFKAINLEGEAARIPGEVGDANMTSFTGSILLAPPLGFLQPYGGIGIGIFRQTVGTTSDTGTVRSFALGLKVHIGLAVLKGEYRQISLSGEPLIDMDKRVSFGAGISF